MNLAVRPLEHMYSMDHLLHLLHSDGADELRLHVGQPPVIVLDGELQPLEGPAITAEDAEQLLQSISNTRHRRELREQGMVEFICRFRNRANFVIRARMEGENIGMDIH
jgi:twitching motility protein PilT